MKKCWACDGTGGSGEFMEDSAPDTWDEPGWYEVSELPCAFCRGTGLVPDQSPVVPTTPFMPPHLDDDTPF